MIPTHVADHINTTTGLAITKAGGRDTATWRPCPKCHARTLVGLDDTTAALTATTDPRLLTRSDEATAWLTGRTTYQLHPHGPRLRRRNHWAITGHPADTVPVVADHTCSQPLGTPIPASPTKEQHGDRIPY